MFNNLKLVFMKKIYCFVATAVIAVISIYTYKHINNLSVFMEANVEALANTENKESITCLMVESYGVKQYGYFCLRETTNEHAYQCPPPEVQKGATSRKCY